MSASISVSALPNAAALTSSDARSVISTMPASRGSTITSRSRRCEIKASAHGWIVPFRVLVLVECRLLRRGSDAKRQRWLGRMRAADGTSFEVRILKRHPRRPTDLVRHVRGNGLGPRPGKSRISSRSRRASPATPSSNPRSMSAAASAARCASIAGVYQPAADAVGTESLAVRDWKEFDTHCRGTDLPGRHGNAGAWQPLSTT
jgi:hypothetical protein